MSIVLGVHRTTVTQGLQISLFLKPKCLFVLFCRDLVICIHFLSRNIPFSFEDKSSWCLSYCCNARRAMPGGWTPNWKLQLYLQNFNFVVSLWWFWIHLHEFILGAKFESSISTMKGKMADQTLIVTRVMHGHQKKSLISVSCKIAKLPLFGLLFWSLLLCIEFFKSEKFQSSISFLRP